MADRMLSNRTLLLIGGVAAVATVVALTSGLAVGLTDDDPGDEADNFRRSPSSTLVLADNLAGAPSSSPSISKMPSVVPSTQPSAGPSSRPSLAPSSMPSEVPSDVPSVEPSSRPSLAPSEFPSDTPSQAPSSSPTATPSLYETTHFLLLLLFESSILLIHSSLHSSFLTVRPLFQQCHHLNRLPKNFASKCTGSETSAGKKNVGAIVNIA